MRTRCITTKSQVCSMYPYREQRLELSDTFSIPGAVTSIAGGDIVFPNAFTPGNTGPTDGVYDQNSFDNDIFHPMSEGVQEYHLQVFNRWGELLFETDDIHKGWDGYYAGVCREAGCLCGKPMPGSLPVMKNE